MEIPTQYLVPAAVAAYFAWRWWSFRRVKARLPRLIRDGAQIVDVRTPAEYAAGHFTPSVNISLAQIGAGAARLDKSRAVVLCCASGTRSGMAAGILRGLGFQVVNAGPWTNLV